MLIKSHDVTYSYYNVFILTYSYIYSKKKKTFISCERFVQLDYNARSRTWVGFGYNILKLLNTWHNLPKTIDATTVDSMCQRRIANFQQNFSKAKVKIENSGSQTQLLSMSSALLELTSTIPTLPDFPPESRSQRSWVWGSRLQDENPSWTVYFLLLFWVNKSFLRQWTVFLNRGMIGYTMTPACRPNCAIFFASLHL